MTLFFEIMIVALLIVGAIVFIRVIKGPSISDRIISINVLGTKVSMIIILLSFISGQDSYVSVSLIFAMISFVASIGFAKYIDHGNLT